MSKARAVLRRPLVATPVLGVATALAMMIPSACASSSPKQRPASSGLVAAVWMSPVGSDSGANCRRFAVAVANPDPSGVSLCASFQKTYALAQLGDVVGMDSAHGAYGASGDSLIVDNGAYHWVSSSAYITWQPESGRVQVGSGGTATSAPTRFVLAGARHVHFKNVDFSEWYFGDNDGSWNSAAQVTQDVWMENTTTGVLNFHSLVRFKMTGGTVGRGLGCGSGPPWAACAAALAAGGGRWVTLCSDCENQIVTRYGDTLGNKDVLFDGVAFHDVSSWTGAGSQHTACLKVQATDGFTLRNSKFWNCDSQTLMLTYDTTQTGTAWPVNNVNVLIENNWFNRPSNASATVACACTTLDVGGAPVPFLNGAAIYNWVLRNNTIAGQLHWGNNSSAPRVATPSRNIQIVGNLIEKENCTGSVDSETAPDHVLHTRNLYATSKCGGRDNRSLKTFAVRNAPYPDETGFDFMPEIPLRGLVKGKQYGARPCAYPCQPDQ
jgi:hypothetical protein